MPDRPQIAALVTELRQYTHGQHFVDRFLEGYGWEGPCSRRAIRNSQARLSGTIRSGALFRLASTKANALTVGKNTGHMGAWGFPVSGFCGLLGFLFYFF